MSIEKYVIFWYNVPRETQKLIFYIGFFYDSVSTTLEYMDFLIFVTKKALTY